MPEQTSSPDLAVEKSPEPAVGAGMAGALVDAAKKYAAAVSARKAAKAKEDEIREGLVLTMRKLGRETFVAQGVYIELTHKEGVKVDVQGPEGNGESGS